MQLVAIVVSLIVSVIAVALTGRAVIAMLGVIRKGQPAPGRTGNPVGRTVTMVKETFGHTRMLQWTWVGILHWFAFAAFLFLSTAVGAAFFQLFDPEWTIPLIGKWVVYEWTAEILGLLGTLAIIPLIIYRLTHLPDKLGRQSRFFGSTMWQAYFVEAMVLLESSAILFIRGAEYNLAKAHGGEAAEHATGGHFPISQAFGNLYPTGSDSIGSLENIVFFIAMVKIVSAMIWLIVISTNLTMGVAWHRFTAWFNIWFKREDSGRTALGALKPLTSGGKAITLDDIDDLDEDATLGAGTIWDFSWKDILDFTTCTECGRCQSQCPAWHTEKPLSPKLMMMAMREQAYAAAGGVEGAADRALVGKSDHEQSDGVDDWFYMPEGGDFVIDEDALWACTNCGACVQQCPVDIEHVDHFVDMRRYQVLVESNFPSELNGLFKGLENKGNPWNMSATARLDWAKDLPFEVKVVGDQIEDLESVDWLFWVGCAGAYEDRAKKTTRAVAELLDLAGVSFGVLGNGETCTGDPARRAGNEFVFQGLAQQNIEVLTEAKAKKVVSTCPHCMNTLKNEYRDLGIELEVIHHTQLLNRLVREGKLTPVDAGAGAHDRKITYHDPCFLGRHNQVYSPPRDLLEILPGAEFAEMERNKEKSFCCGAGGARMWMEETIGERINLNRTAEAIGTGADQIAVGCPFCRVMLSDGLTKMQADLDAREEVEVLDVAQMLLASVKGEQATKLAPGEGTPLADLKAKAAADADAKAKKAAAAKQADAGAAAAGDAEGVATKAEPEAGDVTITEDTVVDTEDVGPAAKAAGGSSMFDDPGSMFDEPAAKPADKSAATSDADKSAEAKPAASGSLFDDPGSMFDEPAPAAEKPSADGGSLFDEPAPASKTAAGEPAGKKSTADAEKAATGGSLFDEGGSLFDTPAEPAAAPAAKPDPAAGDDQAAAEPTAEKPAVEKPAEPAAEKPAQAAAPEVDLSAGGSLFDIAPSEPAVPAEPTAETAKAETPEAEAPKAEVPKEETAPEAKAPAKAAPEAEAVAPQPELDLSSGSLFDIPASEPAPVAAAAPAPAAEEPVAEESAAEASTDVEADASDTSAGGATSADTVTEAATDEGPAADAESEAGAEVAEPAATSGATTAPEPAPSPVASTTAAASTPQTDVDINAMGSLFDIAAPEATSVERPAAAEEPAEPAATAAEPDAEPEGGSDTAQAEPDGSEPAPAAEPAAETESEDSESEPAAAPEAAAESGSSEPETADAEPEAAEPEAAKPDVETETEAAEPEAAEPEAAGDKPAPPKSSGAAHQPRTDADINETGSLFDL